MLMAIIMRVAPRAKSNGAAHYHCRVADQYHDSPTVSPKPILLREARREDVPEIVALLADDLLGAGREGPADDVYFAAFDQIEADPKTHLLVAEVDGRVVGTLQLTMLPGLSRHGMLRAQIEAVRVAADQRGQRLGRQMIEWAIEAAHGQGCGLVQLTSDKQRPDAIRFYQSLGFTASHGGLKLPLLPCREWPSGEKATLPTCALTAPGPATTRTRRDPRSCPISGELGPPGLVSQG
jgi:GNAT superfamily N-acetyltransferase